LFTLAIKEKKKTQPKNALVKNVAFLFSEPEVPEVPEVFGTLRIKRTPESSRGQNPLLSRRVCSTGFEPRSFQRGRSKERQQKLSGFAKRLTQTTTSSFSDRITQP